MLHPCLANRLWRQLYVITSPLLATLQWRLLSATLLPLFRDGCTLSNSEHPSLNSNSEHPSLNSVHPSPEEHPSLSDSTISPSTCRQLKRVSTHCHTKPRGLGTVMKDTTTKQAALPALRPTPRPLAYRGADAWPRGPPAPCRTGPSGCPGISA